MPAHKPPNPKYLSNGGLHMIKCEIKMRIKSVSKDKDDPCSELALLQNGRCTFCPRFYAGAVGPGVKRKHCKVFWEEHQSLTTLSKNSAWEHEMKECTRSAECVCRDMAGDHSQRDDVLPDRLRLQFWLPSWLQCLHIAILPPYNMSYCRGSAKERWQGRRRTPRRRWTLASLLLLLDFV